MDLVELENKLKEIGSDKSSVPTQNVSNTITPISVTKKISTISDEEVQNYSDKVIPSWNDLQTIYESRWRKEKEKFQAHLKANFTALIERYASGKQELFQLCVPERREKLYITAFLELFESGYAPHVGDVERIANKRVRKLFITLPHNYCSTY
tara:strand:+ start:385 stop:843 length:459 start_codon:yes stop_codon:yes gene_type:complete